MPSKITDIQNDLASSGKCENGCSLLRGGRTVWSIWEEFHQIMKEKEIKHVYSGKPKSMENSAIFCIYCMETHNLGVPENHEGLNLLPTPTDTQLIRQQSYALMVESTVCPLKTISFRLEKGRCPLPSVGMEDGSGWKSHSYLMPPWVTSLARWISCSPARKRLTDLEQV